MRQSPVIAVALVSLAFGVVAVPGSALAASATTKEYSDCGKLWKDFPSGVAGKPMAVVVAKKYDWKPPKVDPAVFSANHAVDPEYLWTGTLCHRLAPPAARFGGYSPPQIVQTSMTCTPMPNTNQWDVRRLALVSGGTKWTPARNYMRSGNTLLYRTQSNSVFERFDLITLIDPKGGEHIVPFSQSQVHQMYLQKECPHADEP